MARTARRKAAPPSAQMTMPMDVATCAVLVVQAPAPPPSSGQMAVPATAEPMQDVHEVPVISPVRPQTLAEIDPRYAHQPPAFGAWLLKQKERGGFVGDLAKAAVADRGFPKAGDPDTVRKRLETVGADGDMFEALDDAERVWLAAV